MGYKSGGVCTPIGLYDYNESTDTDKIIDVYLILKIWKTLSQDFLSGQRVNRKRFHCYIFMQTSDRKTPLIGIRINRKNYMFRIQNLEC